MIQVCFSIVGRSAIAAVALGLLVVGGSLNVVAAADAVAVSYWKDVRPIFQANCQGCHQPAKSGGEYVMTSFDTMLSGGETGEAAIVPQDPDASQLLRQITPVEGKAPMPQGKPPLAAEQIAVIRDWIARRGG